MRERRSRTGRSCRRLEKSELESPLNVARPLKEQMVPISSKQCRASGGCTGGDREGGVDGDGGEECKDELADRLPILVHGEVEAVVL